MKRPIIFYQPDETNSIYFKCQKPTNTIAIDTEISNKEDIRSFLKDNKEDIQKSYRWEDNSEILIVVTTNDKFSKLCNNIEKYKNKY